jgi:cobalamin biosynthesis Mg chelatase CobN
MQVSLATGKLSRSKASQAASYSFTVFAIVGSLVVLILVLVVFLVLFVFD